MEIRQALKKYPQVEIELLLAHVLKKPKEFLFMEPEYQLSVNQQISLQKMVRRREKGEPMAYILGYKDFYGLRFKVNKNVLIPRPETEWMADHIIKNVIPEALSASERLSGIQTARISGSRLSDATVRDDTVKILDVGTGSGCIIISLANQLISRSANQQIQFYASDISKEALVVAKNNAKAHSVKVKFIYSDILENVRMNFDIIIANLPYLAPAWESPNLKHEPKTALYAKEHGLMLIRELLEQIANLPAKPKLVYLEFDPRQKSALAKLIKKSLPGPKVKFYKDYNKFWRYAEITI